MQLLSPPSPLPPPPPAPAWPPGGRDDAWFGPQMAGLMATCAVFVVAMLVLSLALSTIWRRDAER